MVIGCEVGTTVSDASLACKSQTAGCQATRGAGKSDTVPPETYCAPESEQQHRAEGIGPHPARTDRNAANRAAETWHAVSKNGFTALIRAAYRGNPECVRLLLEAGADGTRRDCFGKTALEYAENNGHGEVASLLRR